MAEPARFAVGDAVRVRQPGYFAHGRRFVVEEIFPIRDGALLYALGPIALPADWLEPAGD